MRSEITRLAWGERVARVQAFLACRLDEDLDLDRLAEVACSSRFHFHRRWVAINRETVADTVRRLRLHWAAAQLIQSEADIAALARAAGYGSVAAFGRVFQGSYGVPPARYRAIGRLIPPLVDSNPEEKVMGYEVEIKDMAPARLLCAEHRSSYQEIGHAFQRIMAFGSAHGLRGPDTRDIGVYYDDPTVVPAKNLRSVAGMSVGPDVQADGDRTIVELQGGRCAVLHHVGPYAELPKAYDWLFGTWLPEKGLEPADRPPFEEYINDPRTLPPSEWRTEVCVPLR